MLFSLTVVSPDASAAETALTRARAALEATGGRVKPEEPLGPGALDAQLEHASLESARAAAQDAAAGLPVDLCLQPAAGRKKRLLLADMDSTIIACECLDELADFAGKKAEVAAVTEQAMRGELAFEPALRARVATLAGLPLQALDRCLQERVRLNPGAATLVRTMAAHGATTVLVSGGFEAFTGPVSRLAGFSEHHANRLLHDGERLTGRVAEPILGREAKLATLQRRAGELGLDLAETLAVGDGANDLAMIEAAGLGVAYRAKPVVAAQADARVEHADLTALLYFQGYGEAAFVGG